MRRQIGYSSISGLEVTIFLSAQKYSLCAFWNEWLTREVIYRYQLPQKDRTNPVLLLFCLRGWKT